METRKILAILVLALGLMVWAVEVSEAEPMGTGFTYQGGLMDKNKPANDLYDFEFSLYADPNDGTQLGSTVDVNELDVIDGSFAVKLDFGSNVFDGNAVWLEIGVRPGDLNDPNAYTTLSPRQELTPTPYAMHSENAHTLDSFDSAAFASSAHNHDGVYASVAHSHDGVYALISHAHDDRYYTETELQSSGSASVHWDNLRNVPADIADGDDDTDTQLTEAQVDAYVSNNGYLDTETDPTVLASVKDGVSWAEIAGIPADIADGDDDTDTQLTEAQVDVYVSNNGYLDTETDPTVLASVKDGVSWVEIASIPADIADGDDDTQLTEAQVDAYVSNNGYLDTETDPTVLASVKDGVSWAEIAGIPADIADGDNDTDTQLTEAQVDAYVANNGYGTVSSWADIPDIPADIADGDDDTQLTEVQVDAYVANNGYLDGSSALDWDNITIDMPAGFADGVDNVGGGDSDWTISDGNMYSGVSGNVGIGSTSPAAKLTVNGAILREGSTMYGNYTERHINLGTNSTTGTDGPDLYSYPTVGGGGSNEASGNCATVGGGWDNTASGATATIGGGVYNTASGASATVGGGNDNYAGGDHYCATVAGGKDNQANSDYTTVGGGHYNNAGGYGPTASGHYATVPGGRSNTADGSYSFAAGRRAKANHQGAFVWGDSIDADFASTGNNQLLIRASGGVGIGTNSPGGFQLAVNGSAAKPGGGSWSVFSDSRLKKNIEPLDGALDRMLQLKGVSFEYSDSEHFSYVEGEQMGMIAQEVENVFPDWVDQSGGYKTVTYRGFEAITVESFRQLRKEKDAEIAALKEQNEKIQARLAAMETAVAKLTNQQEGGI